ncbi:MAG TPA: hypothetical protein VIG30_12495 [Ktedonobacterales bacterium]|jgi:hypothetical protein
MSTQPGSDPAPLVATQPHERDDTAQPAPTLLPREPHELDLPQAVFAAYLEVVKAHVERDQARVTLLMQGAGTLATVYAALVGVVFAAGKGAQISSAGFIPPLFLGLALLAAGFYQVYIIHHQPKTIAIDHTPVTTQMELFTLQVRQLNQFYTWLIKRDHPQWLLHVALCCFGIAIVFLPAGYLVQHSATLLGIPADAVAWILGGLILALLLGADFIADALYRKSAAFKRKPESLGLPTNLSQ